MQRLVYVIVHFRLCILSAKVVRGCCYKIKVSFTKGHAGGAITLHPYMFTIYMMEPGLVNGRNHYTSQDGRFAVSFCGDSWWIQAEDTRQVERAGFSLYFVNRVFQLQRIIDEYFLVSRNLQNNKP
jgi:hypothetical protein